MNRWGYVEGNSVNFVDPTGHYPIIDFYRIGAYLRFFEIDKQGGNNAARKLVRIFEDEDLYSKWGLYAGKTSSRRLEFLLEITKSHIIYPIQFMHHFGNDECFQKELRDSHHYYAHWTGNTQDSNQAGHFLTAVAIEYQGFPFGAKLSIRHEQVDDGHWTNKFFFLVTNEELEKFEQAINADELGDYKKRDELLEKIIRPDDDLYTPSRIGNSIEDLRLTVRGFRFARWVKTNAQTHPRLAGAWLRQNIMNLPSTTPRPNWR